MCICGYGFNGSNERYILMLSYNMGGFPYSWPWAKLQAQKGKANCTKIHTKITIGGLTRILELWPKFLNTHTFWKSLCVVNMFWFWIEFTPRDRAKPTNYIFRFCGDITKRSKPLVIGWLRPVTWGKFNQSQSANLRRSRFSHTFPKSHKSGWFDTMVPGGRLIVCVYSYFC